MQRSRKPASMLLLVALITTSVSTPLTAAKSLSSLKKQLNSTSSKINDVKHKLRRTKNRERNAVEKLAIFQRKLEINRITLNDTRSQLRDTRGKLAKTRAELQATEKRLKERNDLLSERLVDAYKHGSVSYLSVLLGAADFWDLLNRGYVVRKIAERDVELLEAIRKDKQEIERHKALLEEQERRRLDLERRHAHLTYTVERQTVQHRHMLRDITQERANYEQILALYKAESEEIAAMIRRMQQTPSGRKRLSRAWSGSFIAPVEGRVTSGFGMRYHPILGRRSMHTGVDIAAPAGTTIRAADGGYIFFAGWKRAYGWTVVIDHGGDMISFYGHCSSFLVSAGTSVKRGQPIARVGSTGLSTGPHVHFEVQKNGVPISPF